MILLICSVLYLTKDIQVGMACADCSGPVLKDGVVDFAEDTMLIKCQNCGRIWNVGILENKALAWLKLLPIYMGHCKKCRPRSLGRGR